MQLPGTGEILLILLLCLVVFGGSKVNPLGDLVGGFMKGLRRGMSDDPRIQVRPAPGDDQGRT
jgi:Sec-independent protein translocase protein TatA